MKPFRDQPRERQTLKQRPTSTGHRASVYTEVFEHILAFTVTEGSAAAKAGQRMLLRAQGGFDAHHFVFRLTRRAPKLGGDLPHAGDLTRLNRIGIPWHSTWGRRTAGSSARPVRALGV